MAAPFRVIDLGLFLLGSFSADCETRFWISLVSWRKAVSTLWLPLALVSKNGMALVSANSCATDQKLSEQLYTQGRVSCLGCCKVHNLLLVKVTLVAHQHFVHMFMAVPINLRKPTLNCSETVLVCDVINHDDTCIRRLNVRPGAQDDCVAAPCAPR